MSFPLQKVKASNQHLEGVSKTLYNVYKRKGWLKDNCEIRGCQQDVADVKGRSLSFFIMRERVQ